MNATRTNVLRTWASPISLALLALLALAAMILATAQALAASSPQPLRFDVAEDMTRFAFAKEPVDEKGMPAYGNPFVTQGYIYEYGTLNGTNGVLPDGRPEFPEKVIGTWTCRGWFVGNGAATKTGPMVITTQLYAFDEAHGGGTLATDGYELADVEKAVARAITGGTGPFKLARGDGQQVLLGLNATEGVNLRFELQPQAQ